MYRGSTITPLQGVSHDWQWVTWMKTQEPFVPGLLYGFKRRGGWLLRQRNHLGGSRFDRLYDRFLHLACPPHTASDFNHTPTQLCRDMRGHVGIFHKRLLKDIALFYFTCTPNQLEPFYSHTQISWEDLKQTLHLIAIRSREHLVIQRWEYM